MGFFTTRKSDRAYRKGYCCKQGHIQADCNDLICQKCGEAVSKSVVYGHWDYAFGGPTIFIFEGVKSVESLR